MSHTKLASGEIVMWVCQGAVIRVLDAQNKTILFELDPPNEHSLFKDINKNGSVIVEFTSNDKQKEKSTWLYNINVKKKTLVPVRED